jgi:hypothetical protein
MKRFGFHNCAWDPECRRIMKDPPSRLYLKTPVGALIVALNWDSRTQAWLPVLGYTPWWWLVVWSPRRAKSPRWKWIEKLYAKIDK